MGLQFRNPAVVGCSDRSDSGQDVCYKHTCVVHNQHATVLTCPRSPGIFVRFWRCCRSSSRVWLSLSTTPACSSSTATSGKFSRVVVRSSDELWRRDHLLLTTVESEREREGFIFLGVHQLSGHCCVLGQVLDVFCIRRPFLLGSLTSYSLSEATRQEILLRRPLFPLHLPDRFRVPTAWASSL